MCYCAVLPSKHLNKCTQDALASLSRGLRYQYVYKIVYSVHHVNQCGEGTLLLVVCILCTTYLYFFPVTLPCL